MTTIERPLATADLSVSEAGEFALGDRVFSFADPTLHRLGSIIPMEGQVSWAPAIPGQYQPINCYLVMEGDSGYLIDTGVAAHRAQILQQLDSLLPHSKELTVVFTRAELDCSGNFAAIHKHRTVAEVVSGAVRNPFDSYDEISRMSNTEIRRQSLPLSGTTTMPIAQSKRLILVPPHIRMLTTYWIYDRVTKTMFTSDMFGHTTVSGPKAPIIINKRTNDPSTLETVKLHLLEKFFWMEIADTSYMVTWLQELFAAYEIENIAPTHGSILVGRDVVQRHFELLVQAMQSVSIKRAQ